MNALFGSTGFVGRHLQQQLDFDAVFHRTNASEARGGRFELLVVAAARGSMFRANRNPQADSDNINRLLGVLRKVKASHLVLVSTIAVLAEPGAGQNEDEVQHETTMPYGKHRRALEMALTAEFPRSLVVRIPTPFGEGMTRNFLFDVLNPVPSLLERERFELTRTTLGGRLGRQLASVYTAGDDGLLVCDRQRLATLPVYAELADALVAEGLSALHFTNSNSRIQFYPLERLGSDIAKALAAELDVLHLATAPLRAADVGALAGHVYTSTGAPAYSEDFRTRHASQFNGVEGYVIDRTGIRRQLAAFISRHQGREPAAGK